MEKFILWFIVWILLTLTTLSFLGINVFEIYNLKKEGETFLKENLMEQKNTIWYKNGKEYLPTDGDINDFDKSIKEEKNNKQNNKVNILPPDFRDL